MKSMHVFILLCLFGFHTEAEAQNGISLNEAVNQAKSEGRVLSAKTINGRHEVKVLTRNGTVKTINKQAINGRHSSQNQNGPNLNNRNQHDPQIRRNYYNQDTRSQGRDNSERNQLKLKETNQRSRSDRDDGHNQQARPSSNRSNSNYQRRSNSNRTNSNRNNSDRNRSNHPNGRVSRDDGNNSRSRDH